MTPASDTIAAIATPPGAGAIGIIRLSGPDAIPIADACFRGKPLREQASHTIHFGTLRDEQGRILDEVLVSLFVGPKSYTGEDVVEVSCHGSHYILEEALRLFLRRGARLAQPGEFTLRAFLNGRMDLSQAEAVADLIASASAASHRLAMQQLRGGVSEEIRRLRQELLDFASLIELELDFGEEDVEFADRTQLHNLLDRVRTLIRTLLDSFQFGNAVRQGVSTVIAGRPNAGKSTLLNALLNEERAIVSEIAGTTRDTIEETLHISGISFRIIDTAGIREAHDAIEAIGVARTFEKVRQSAVLLYVFDAARSNPEQVRQDIAQLLHEDLRVLVVANKIDLAPSADFAHYFPEADSPIGAAQWVPISAAQHTNIDLLKEKLHELVVREDLPLDGAILSNARHSEALYQALESIEEAARGLYAGIPSDLIAMDIRRALHYLGEITGEVSVEDLLGNIFGKFCIGK